MSLFVIVIIHDLTYVFFLLSIVTDLCVIDSCGRDRIPLGFVLLLLLVFSGLIGRLRILNKSKYGSFSLGFVFAMIFYRSLSLDFVCTRVSRSIPSGDLLIGLSYVGT